jgi:hypothetical protein
VNGGRGVIVAKGEELVSIFDFSVTYRKIVGIDVVHGTWPSRTESSRRSKDSEYGTEDRDSPPESGGSGRGQGVGIAL